MQSRNENKLDYIDAMRGLAILAVIMVHSGQYGGSDLPKTMIKIINEGARGVQLFFLASAFTLFLSFKNRNYIEKRPIRNFFIRRFFRIAPIYYLGIIYYLHQNGFGPRYWLGSEPQITVLNIFSNFTFTHGFYPYWITAVVPGGWSIAVEMTFYAFLPLIFQKIKTIEHAFKFLLFSLVCKIVLEIVLFRNQLIIDDDLWKNYLFLYFPSQLPVFAMGIVMYFLIIENASLNQISGQSIFLLLGLLAIQFVIQIDIFPNPILFGFVFFLIGIGLSKFNLYLIVNPIVKYIGKISFSMYLVHFAILYWLSVYHFVKLSNNGILNFFMLYFIVVLLTVIVSTVLYNSIEVPFQKIGKKIIARLEAKESAA